MTPYEFTEINRKYGFQAMFNSKLKAVSKEEYEEMINGLVVVLEALFTMMIQIRRVIFKWQRDTKK